MRRLPRWSFGGSRLGGARLPKAQRRMSGFRLHKAMSSIHIAPIGDWLHTSFAKYSMASSTVVTPAKLKQEKVVSPV